MRIHEPPSGWYVCKQDIHGGTTFRPGDKPSKKKEDFQPQQASAKVRKRKNWGIVQWTLHAAVASNDLQSHAVELGLSTDSLSGLGIGFHGKWECWTFPMYSEDLVCVGIRCRGFDGKKWSIPGSSDGIFCGVVPLHQWPDEVFVCEGPTDTAALLDLGLFAIGRPSCRGAVLTIKKLLQGRQAVIVSDADGPGREGAEHLAETLCPTSTSVKVIEPPCKDIRAWKARGTNEAAVRLLVEHAKERRHEKRKQVQRRAC